MLYSSCALSDNTQIKKSDLKAKQAAFSDFVKTGGNFNVCLLITCWQLPQVQSL